MAKGAVKKEGNKVKVEDNWEKAFKLLSEIYIKALELDLLEARYRGFPEEEEESISSFKEYLKGVKVPSSGMEFRKVYLEMEEEASDSFSYIVDYFWYTFRRLAPSLPEELDKWV